MHVHLLAVILLAFASESAAQTRKPATVSEIVTYAGADREQLLYAGAKNEGTVTWYTSLAGDSYKAMARAFENRYPGVRVETYRAGGSELVVRMAEEVKARRPIFDALETTYDFMMVSRANHLTRPYISPALAAYPAEAKEKADNGLTFWTIFPAVQPPHPHAAALFIDYLLSPNGRTVLEKYQYRHPSDEWPFKRWHPGFGRSLEQFEKDSDKWEKLAKEITRR